MDRHVTIRYSRLVPASHEEALADILGGEEVFVRLDDESQELVGDELLYEYGGVCYARIDSHEDVEDIHGGLYIHQ